MSFLSQGASKVAPWKVLLVDDEPDIHDITKLTLNRFRLDGRPLTFLHAYNTALAKEVLRDLPEVSVTGYTGLTVEFARANGFKAIIRGLRAISDFEYEFQLATMNRHLIDGVETIFLTPSEHHTFISSSLVREIAEFGGDVSAFVHPVVAERLKQKLRLR